MGTENLDPDRYKAGERQTWDAVAAGWNRWWTTFEQGAQTLSDHLIELAAIRSGHSVLDVATGIGEPAFTAGRRVRPTGRVVAIDQSPQMLAIAAERAATMGLDNVELREMDAEALDFPQETFHAILCRWGLMFLPNLETSLSSMRQLLVPGGRLAAAVWSLPVKVPLISLAMGVVRQVVEMPTAAEGTPTTFGLSDPTALERAMTHAGFSQVSTECRTVALEFPSGEAYASFILDVSGSVSAMLASQPVQKQLEVRREIEKAVEQFAAVDGQVTCPTRLSVWLADGNWVWVRGGYDSSTTSVPKPSTCPSLRRDLPFRPPR